MTQNDIELTPTYIKYDEKLLVDKLNQQIETIMGLQYKFSSHTKKDYHKKYLSVVLQNIHTISECFSNHSLVKQEELKKIDEKIEMIKKLLIISNKDDTVSKFHWDADELISIYISELLDILFLLDIYDDGEDIEEELEDSEDECEADPTQEIEEELKNKPLSDHASVINIENDNKKRKCEY